MKKIGRIVLHNNAELLDTPEMKMIRGGYSDGGGGYDKDCCAWAVSLDPLAELNCSDNATAMKKGALPGWWGCNSVEVKNKCGC